MPRLIGCGKLPVAAALFEKLPRQLRRHRLMRWWMKVTGEDPVQLVRIRGDAFGYADLRDGFLRLIVIDGNFESDFFRIADALLSNGGVFLDGGANYGLLSLGLAGRHGDRIDFHLFEPNPHLVATIRRSVARYPRMRCTVVAAALSDREGTVRFYFDDAQTGASHIAANGGSPVTSLTIDAYIGRVGIDRVELLKMDVEGYELVALRGAKDSLEAQVIRAIYFEYFEKWLMRVQPPGELLSFLDGAGYEVCFCRLNDVENAGGATHTIRRGLPGNGLSLRPIRGHRVPEMTDLLALPKQNLAALP
jgi:FkbM family methyltransferase